MNRLFVAVALAATASTSLVAQRLGPALKRPHLRDVVDTNDAQAYYSHGLSVFEQDPEEAAVAFYWAARINPAWGEPLYARRAALIMADQGMLRGVMEDNRRTLESSEMKRLDSLQFRALMLSPFLYRQFDRVMFTSYFRNAVKRDIRASGGNDQASDLDYLIENYLRTAGEQMRAFIAYGDGDFANALIHYANALTTAKDKSGIRLERARILAKQGQVQSAVAEFHLALDEMRKKDQKDLVLFYNSKAQVDFSIAVLLEGNGDVAAARDAYGSALQEDIAYYPAHLRLGLLALGAKDTSTALSELALASQIAPEEPHVRYIHGYVLIAAGHYADAVTELQKSVELEPYYALPQLWLGQVYEQLGKGPEALSAYERYLARSSMNDGQRALATARRDEVKEILAAVPSKP